MRNDFDGGGIGNGGEVGCMNCVCVCMCLFVHSRSSVFDTTIVGRVF